MCLCRFVGCVKDSFENPLFSLFTFQAILTKARQGDSFGDLLPEEVLENRNTGKRERLGEEGNEINKRVKLENATTDVGPTSLDDVMFEEELFDRFSDDEDDKEVKKEATEERSLESQDSKRSHSPPLAPFVLFSTLNTGPPTSLKEAIQPIPAGSPVKTVVKLKMSSAKEVVMEKMEVEGHKEKENSTNTLVTSSSDIPWIATSKMQPLSV